MRRNGASSPTWWRLTGGVVSCSASAKLLRARRRWLPCSSKSSSCHPASGGQRYEHRLAPQAAVGRRAAARRPRLLMLLRPQQIVCGSSRRTSASCWLPQVCTVGAGECACVGAQSRAVLLAAHVLMGRVQGHLAGAQDKLWHKTSCGRAIHAPYCLQPVLHATLRACLSLPCCLLDLVFAVILPTCPVLISVSFNTLQVRRMWMSFWRPW